MTDEEAAWNASMSNLSDPSDVDGIVKKLRGAPQAMAMGHVSAAYNAKACYEAADLIDRLSAQLAEARFHHGEASKDRATLAQLHNDAVQQLAERDAELAEERKHAEAMANSYNWESAGRILVDLSDAIEAYRAFRGTK